jgi:hypothetical protein
MSIKKFAGAVVVAGALGAAGLGIGAGSAQADPIWVPDIPWIPWGAGHWVDEFVPDVIPDVNLGAPGWYRSNVPGCPPPGHWMGGPHGPIPCMPGWR